MQISKVPEDVKFSNDFLRFFKKLHPKFSTRQRRILRERSGRLESSRNGGLPVYKGRQSANSSVWKAPLPDWMSDQRNQMTGPADNAELVVKMINSGSPGVMLDLEDSMKNEWSHLEVGVNNVKAALYGELSYTKKGKKVTADPKGTVIFTRVRGLHMQQEFPSRLKKSEHCSASLFDLALLFFDLDISKLEHAPCIYIPKSEGSNEAKWWKEVFIAIEKARSWPRGTIKCMALVESHSMAYEIEEFAFNLQPYLVGLNLGRWDYMASLIDYLYHRDGWLFPDRNSIPTEVPFFQNLRHWMAHICHKHGMLAIGGMSALFPDRKNSILNIKAQKKLAVDKGNEASCLMDGAWTGHPDQNDIAVKSFPSPNQLDKMPGLEEFPDLREFENDGPVTEEGTREAIRVCIQYRQGVESGKGSSLINGYMEDLATDRIYRILIAQRIDRGVHSEDEVMDMFVDETGKMIEQRPDINWLLGRDATFNLIKTRQFNPK